MIDRRKKENMTSSTYSQVYAPKNVILTISGIIGVGKTTLTRSLGEALGANTVYEPVETNEYLDKFYADKEAFAFPMQVYLLNHRFRQHQQMVWSDRDVVQDRSIYEDVIFGKLLKDAGIMSDLDFETYRSLYLNMTNFLHRPDLIIYLDTSPEVALERVRERARSCENGVDLEYLKALKAGYEEWLVDVEPRIPVLRLDWDEFHDTNEVVAKINQKLADRRGLVF